MSWAGLLQVSESKAMRGFSIPMVYDYYLSVSDFFFLDEYDDDVNAENVIDHLERHSEGFVSNLKTIRES